MVPHYKQNGTGIRNWVFKAVTQDWVFEAVTQGWVFKAE